MTDQAQRNKGIVLEVLTKSFTDRDFTALKRWLSPDYIQHNPVIPGTREGLLAFLANYPEGRHYEPGLMIAEGDLVIAYGRYAGGGKKTLIAADIFRFEADVIVEHWDVLQEEIITETTVAGNPMFTTRKTRGE
jgi:predicted SnoaL-like aldol condensation-catalyzing enzyme